ncbi:MAG: pyridoxamine 5'-phosphate oxidase family protein [Frankiaceae bacterium]
MSSLPVDHAGLAVLPFDECIRLIGATPVGRVAFAMAGEIEIMPVNHTLDGTTVVFRTATGSKLTAATQASVVAFEVDSWDAVIRDGWSVVVHGRAEQVTDRDQLRRLEALTLRPWADAVERPQWVRILPDAVTGRRVRKRATGK